MLKCSLMDGPDAFEVTVLEASAPRRVVLFAVGGGGDPERHLPLLSALREHQCTVIAPHFARLLSPRATADHLLLRGRRLKQALDAFAKPELPIAGIGHSIGGAMLLGLAGGTLWMSPNESLSLVQECRLDRLVLMAPTTAFFRGPGALTKLRIPIFALVGTADTLTPPSNVQFLKDTLAPHVDVNVELVEGAGHFSFMNTPPPNIVEPLADRDTFLAALTQSVCAFVTNP